MDNTRTERTSKRIRGEIIIHAHRGFLEWISNKYKFLGYHDIYNEASLHLLEAYKLNRDDPPGYALNKLRQYIDKEKKNNKNINYGLSHRKAISKTPLIESPKKPQGIRNKILELKLEYGYTQKEIGSILGISQPKVSRLYKQALEEKKRAYEKS